MVWVYEKFKGDMAIYAFCPKCNFYHNPSRFNHESMECDIMYQYNYCPICGEHLHDENFESGVEVAWDERNIIELYK